VDRIGVVGTSHRSTSITELEAATLPATFAEEHLQRLAQLAGFTELVYLGTCNRSEFYYSAETKLHTDSMLFHLRSSLADLTNGACQLPTGDGLNVLHGSKAARHLFHVCSALDSMMVGEAQITGQTKAAYETSQALGLVGGPLDQTFQEAFHVAKRVRSETELTRRPVSLVTLVERTLHEHLAATTAPVLLLGAGEMAQQALRLIRTAENDRQVLLANRSLENAQTVAHSDAATTPLDLGKTLAAPPTASTIITATAADQLLVDASLVAAVRDQLPSTEQLLLIDLAMPANIDPTAGELGGVTLLGIEQMRAEAEHNRQLRLKEMGLCEQLVEHQLVMLRRKLLNRNLSPAATTLQHALQEVADKALQHALSKELAHLGPDDHEALRRMVRSLVKRSVQVPLRGLKGAAWHHSSTIIASFVRGIRNDYIPPTPPAMKTTEPEHE